MQFKRKHSSKNRFNKAAKKIIFPSFLFDLINDLSLEVLGNAILAIDFIPNNCLSYSVIVIYIIVKIFIGFRKVNIKDSNKN